MPIFGSFTEEETRSWLMKSFGNGDMPTGNKELQINPQMIVPETFVNSPSDDSSRQMGLMEALNFQSSNLSTKDNESKCEKLANGIIPKSSAMPSKNGNGHDLPHLSPSNDAAIVKTNVANSTSSPSSSDGFGVLNQISSLSLRSVDHGSVKDRESNGKVVDSSPFIWPTEDNQNASIEPAMASKDLIPRGLINSGNSCFLNATLQALLSCPPFVQLLQEVRGRNIPKTGYPTLSAFVEFISDFDVPSDLNLVNKEMNSVGIGRPLAPKMFKGVLNNFHPDFPNGMLAKPSQQDAQEFLSFIMWQMHFELIKLEGQVPSSNGGNSSLVSSAGDDEWETVGPKNKSAVTRTQSLVPSELSAIFGGQLSSVVKASGNRASATIQPFFLLELDICAEAVHTVEDALRLFSAPEPIKGYRAPASGKAATASKSVKIQTPSKIMILLLKRFQYIEGCTKLHKPVHFPHKLILSRELLVSPSTEGRRYELVAAITHHGREPWKGHYTTDARYPNGQWLRFNDSLVSAISLGMVLREPAYVLFYEQV